MKFNSATQFLKANWLILLFLVAVFLLSVNQLKEFDVWYHLKTGEYIVQNLTVPTHDIFSYTAPGAEWITHSWLAEVIFYLVSQLFGLGGLVVLSALFAAATYYLVIRLAIKLDANPYIIIFLLFFLPVSAVIPLWVPRPQIFSYLFLSVVALLLEGYLKSRKKEYLLAIPPIFLLWANMHAGVALGLLLLFFYGLFSRAIILPAALSLGFSFLNPNTYKIFTYQFAIQEVAKTLRVEEWFSIWIYRGYIGTQIFFVVLLAINALVIASYIKHRTKENARFAALALGFSILPFISVRHLAFFPIIVFPILAVKIGELAIIRNILAKTREDVLKIVFSAVAVIFAVSGFLRLPKTLVNAQVVPAKAVDFIQKAELKGPIFNLYNEGGYLIWRLWPKEKVFIDGRDEVYRGTPLLDFLTIVNFRAGWEKLVNEKYHINAVLLPYRALSKSFVNGAVSEFEKQGFKIVYLDDADLVLLRDVPENGVIIKKCAPLKEKEFLPRCGP